MSVGLLASILNSQGKLGHETKDLYERSLVIDIKKHGPDGKNTAVTNSTIGGFYHKLARQAQSTETRIDHLRLSLSHFKEGLRIYTTLLGPNNPTTVQVSSNVFSISRELSEIE
jgi:hypothetical protein